MVEMNHRPFRVERQQKIPIHCIFMVYPLSDNSISENSENSITEKTYVNAGKSFKSRENKCTHCSMQLLVFTAKGTHRTGDISEN